MGLDRPTGCWAIPSHTTVIGLGATGGGKHNQPSSRICLMSALGQKRKSRLISPMSALLLKADVGYKACSGNFAVGDVVINVFASQPLAGLI
jgi:hypothetical protein